MARFRGGEAADLVLLSALSRGATVSQAAKEAGVSERTAWRRLDDPDFHARLENLQSQTLERQRTKLAELGTQAIDTLGELLKEGELPTVRLGAARAVIDYGLKTRQAVEWEQRVAGLEETIALLSNEIVRLRDRRQVA